VECLAAVTGARQVVWFRANECHSCFVRGPHERASNALVDSLQNQANSCGVGWRFEAMVVRRTVPCAWFDGVATIEAGNGIVKLLNRSGIAIVIAFYHRLSVLAGNTVLYCHTTVT